MKLFYDMLIPYMPDAPETCDSEEAEKLIRASHARKAMIDLSDFQRTNNLVYLYHSVIEACAFMGVDTADTILNVPEDTKVVEGVMVETLIEDSAKSLFRAAIKPDGKEYFDIYQFVCNILMASHAILVKVQEAQEAQEAQETQKCTDSSTSVAEH